MNRQKVTLEIERQTVLYFIIHFCFSIVFFEKLFPEKSNLYSYLIRLGTLGKYSKMGQ